MKELQDAIKALKRGKAVAEDLIANEFIKASNSDLLVAVLHLFNECLKLGVYPWNTSLVTPLHKKGSLYDPNNYRAIAVSSNLGKLFSSVLLQRLIAYKAAHCPDSVNQLGFCKGAQTCDHVLTLTTCIDKYINAKKERLYTCFIDYAKAFDTVCRDALLYKIWKLGINGRFFDCLAYMYSNSTAKIKLLNKLSDKIDILIGTEQGHPMSPELFKCYIHELSEQLNALTGVNVPELNGTRVSHLLWADDLVLLARDASSLQKMIDLVLGYCLEWGLSVNISKTAVMVFNRSGRLLKESYDFKYGDINITSTREYCYLGITFTLSGSLLTAQQKLRQKGLRSYFSLKSTIDISCLRKTVLFKLFDALILPVVSYGCQVWLPETFLFREISSPSKEKRLTRLAKDPMERLHLTFLKWTLGVGKRTSNAAVWGDCGRYPLGVELTKQLYGYVSRLCKLDADNSTSLVRHAFREQMSLNLKWFNGVNSVYNQLTNTNSNPTPSAWNPTMPAYRIRSEARLNFTGIWEVERRINKKLSFYNDIKSTFETEAYLDTDLSYQESKRMAQLRTSAHKLNVESGRFSKNRGSITNRICEFCSSEDACIMTNMAELPFFEPIVEDEYHVLRTCPKYHDIRLKLSDTVKTNLFADTPAVFSRGNLPESARYILKIFKRRFPKITAEDNLQTRG